MLRQSGLGGLVAIAILASSGVAPAVRARAGFDHGYRAYGDLLRAHVRGARVDYRSLKANRAALDAVVDSFGHVTEQDVLGWSRPEQIAFWVNAYNAFTLRAIVDHYPIEGSWFSLSPRNSIRQIDGVWTALRWKAAGTGPDARRHRTPHPEANVP